jgi:hypothetical protein
MGRVCRVTKKADGVANELEDPEVAVSKRLLPQVSRRSTSQPLVLELASRLCPSCTRRSVNTPGVNMAGAVPPTPVLQLPWNWAARRYVSSSHLRCRACLPGARTATRHL